MTQIVLRYPESGSGECAAENSSSLVLLEFQGKFETEQNGTTVLAGMEAGRLVVDNIVSWPEIAMNVDSNLGKDSVLLHWEPKIDRKGSKAGQAVGDHT